MASIMSVKYFFGMTDVEWWNEWILLTVDEKFYFIREVNKVGV